MNEITVLQCLQHTSGMKSEPNGDFVVKPRFWAKRLNISKRLRKNDISRAILQQPLFQNPDKSTIYNNTGYFLAGILIERITGPSYRDYVAEKIFKPLGISSMAIGGSLRKELRKNELRYYSPTRKKLPAATETQLDELVDAAYAWDMDLVDSAGGWVGSTADVARFANSFRDAGNQLISDQSIQKMLRYPKHMGQAIAASKSPSVFYRSAGWEVQSYSKSGELGRSNFYHGGTNDSANTYVVSLRNGLTWVIFCNSRVMPNKPKKIKPAQKYDSRPAKYLSKLLTQTLIKQFSSR